MGVMGIGVEVYPTDRHVLPVVAEDGFADEVHGV